MKISMQSQQDPPPGKRAFEKLEIKQGSTIQFCNYDWIAIQKDSDLTLYKEGLSAVNEIDLTQLFGRTQIGKVQVYFFQFYGGSNDEKHMLLIGNNQFVLYDVISLRNTCKMSLNEEYRLKKKLKFDQVKIQEDQQVLYILTDHFDLITLDLQNRDNDFQYHALMKKGSYLASWLPQNYINFYEQNADFQFIILKEQILIAQQMSQDSMRLILCNQNPYYTLAVSNQNFALEHTTSRIIIHSTFLSQNNGQPQLYIIAVIQNRDICDKPIQIKLISKLIKIDSISNQFQDLANASFCDLNELSYSGENFQSQIFQNNDQLFVFYSLSDCNYYHYDLINQPRVFQYFCGQLQGIGVQQNELQKSLKVCLKGKIYTIKDIEIEKRQKLITHFPERCNNELIFNLLKEGYKQYCENSKSQNAQYLKLEFQAFSDHSICQVIYQIVWDFMETPVHKYQEISIQLKENKNKLELWKGYTKTVVRNKSILLNIIRSQICIEVGLYINKHEHELKGFIQSSLNQWLFQSQYELQFYSKLEDLNQIISQLIKLENYENHLLNILTLIYQNINYYKEYNELQYAKFWVNENEWLELLQQAICNIKQKQGLDLSKLFISLISDCANLLIYDNTIPQSLFSVIYQFTETLSEDQFQQILIENNLHQVLYQCYLQSNLKMNRIFEIIKVDNTQCQIFIDMCIDHEQNNPYQYKDYKTLHLILDQIEETNCVKYVLSCVKNYPKLYNILLIRTQKPEQMNPYNVLMQGVDENAKYYRFLVDTGVSISQRQQENQQQKIEVE